MPTNNIIHLIGYASGIAANNAGCGDGPLALLKSDVLLPLQQTSWKFRWHELLFPHIGDDKFVIVAEICTRLADETKAISERGERFVVLGGDHSCAIGTWSGAYATMSSKGSLGLIWVDAHLDSHTPETSESGNIHGMPVASLLGHGAPSLTQILSANPKILSQNLCIIGARSFEEGEANLIRQLGVRVFYIEEVQQKGLAAVFAEARQIVSQETAAYGISIDLDSIDPQEAPGVGVPTPNGLHGLELCEAIAGVINDPKFIGMEVVEFNPHLDKARRTEQLVYQLIHSMVTSRKAT